MSCLRIIQDEAAMLAQGASLADCFPGQGVIYLRGDLGAGKSTLARGFIRAMGFAGPVKSPTYTLIEPYEIAGKTVYHLDLYRLSDPEELEFIGIRDIQGGNAICLVEWPEKGQGILPEPDIDILIKYLGEGREVSIGTGRPEFKAIINRLC
ncbi:MAG TPA: tRNA (adenosine(37)-N6)-threonylcarbamoyltransferase complex ATPase subunit type 1 TsaE [Gammaproteobacteria bacterium]|nr:tRNA (adenosine(37)-N6)-threonylcarbamoyltransferase complex ATPase subunit type 1 TsaE [Gammaproteobacteria bacterium]